MSKEVCETIIDHIAGAAAGKGRARLAMMLGRGHMLVINADKRSVTLHMPKAPKPKNGITSVGVTLSANDTYSVVFNKWNKKQMINMVVALHDEVYADNLKSLVENATGYYLSI